jgi:sec-independent protein translocase protein TatC
MSGKKKDDDMSFMGHLEELRWRIVKSALAVVAFSIPCYIYWKQIFDLILIHPLKNINPAPRLIYTAPHEAVMLSFKIAIFGGVLGAIPVIFYQLWCFVAPGLYKKERYTVLPVIFSSTFCFLLGITFCYLITPYMMNFMLRYGAGRMDAMLKTDEYIMFILKLSLAFGIIFELPIVSFILSKLGILTPSYMIDKARYAIVIIFIIAAILSPPDVVSQIIMAVPLLVLYAISILVSFIVVKRKKKE